MTNETAGAEPGQSIPPDAAVLALQSVYLKDCSYESPNGPRLDGNWNPQISLDLQTGSTALGPDVREVVLTVTVSAKIGDVTIFLVEIKQADGHVADQHRVPRDPLPLRARGGLAAREPGRLPAVPVAAGQLR